MRRLAIAVAALALLLPSAASAAILNIGSGTLTTGGGLVAGPGGWANAELDYSVTFNDVTDLYTYNYTFDNGELAGVKNISHVLNEISAGFDEDDLETGTTPGGIIGSPNSSGNPGIPSTSINSIKWEDLGEVGEFSWTIVTAIAPVWGNFYAKDGGGPGQEVYSYNSGFSNLTTPCYADSIFDTPTCSGFLLVPDTIRQPPPPDQEPGGGGPEPAVLALFGLGLIAVAKRVRQHAKAVA